MSSELLVFSRQLLQCGEIAAINSSFHDAVPCIQGFDLGLSKRASLIIKFVNDRAFTFAFYFDFANHTKGKPMQGFLLLKLCQECMANNNVGFICFVCTLKTARQVHCISHYGVIESIYCANIANNGFSVVQTDSSVEFQWCILLSPLVP